MTIPLLISLAGFASCVALSYRLYQKFQTGEEHTIKDYSPIALSFLVFMFPTVFWNLFVGLVLGVFQLKNIEIPEYEVRFFDPVGSVCFLISLVMAIVILLKLRKDAQKHGKSLSEYVMSHKPTPDQLASRNTSDDLLDATREAYDAKKGTQYSRHDQ